MDRLHYAGDSLLTGTEIARALLDYAQALAQAGAAATVEIPTLADDGTLVRAEILVGPASQLISTTEDVGFDELEDPGLVVGLRDKAEHLRRYGRSQPAATVADGDEPPTSEWPEFDDL